MKILTVATEYKFYLPYLVDTCFSRGGQGVEILGLNQEWKGFTDKHVLVLQYLSTMNDTDVVCVVDGYDVICLRNLDEMEQEFRALKTEKPELKILCGHCFVTNPVAKLFLKLKYGLWSLNSGTYIGMVRDVKDVLTSIMSDYKDVDDDQVQFILYNDANPGQIQADKTSRLFSVILSPNKQIKPYVHSSAYILHAPGFGLMDDVLKDMGYDVDPYISEEYKKTAVERNMKDFKTYFVVPILLFAVGLCTLWYFGGFSVVTIAIFLFFVITLMYVTE